MALFFISAAILVVICLGWLVLSVSRNGNTESDQTETNIRIAREKLATLDAAKASDAVNAEAYAQERQQLETALAAELAGASDHKQERDGSVAALILAAIFLPISAGAMYLYLGAPEAINITPNTVVANSKQGTEPGVSQAPNLEELLPRLESRLLETPDDVEGWRLLGRTYLTTSNFDGAINALERAVALDDQHTDTIASLAEAIAMQKGGDLSGRPLELVGDALAIDENHQQSVWLLAIGTQQVGDHAAAIEQFDRLSILVAGNQEALATIRQMRLTSEQALGIAVEPVSIQVSVDISEEAKSAVTDTDTVFIFARAQSGPPMPLAVARHTVNELPITITLDESMAMIPNMTLANFPDVVVGARVSASGNAIAESGDWFAEVSLKVSDKRATTTLVIDEKTP